MADNVSLVSTPEIPLKTHLYPSDALFAGLVILNCKVMFIFHAIILGQ